MTVYRTKVKTLRKNILRIWKKFGESAEKA